MYGFTNEAGEPIMDGAAYRYEAFIDSQYEPNPEDTWGEDWGCDDEAEQIDPKVCPHAGDKGFPMGAGMTCEDCWETYEGPQMVRMVAGSIEFPAFMGSERE